MKCVMLSRMSIPRRKQRMENPSVIFGENCFDDSVMQNRLPKETLSLIHI